MSSNDIWCEVLLVEGSSIKDAVKVLNIAALKIVLVVDRDGVLVGTISDGDIRRGLLEGLSLSSPIEQIIHRDALVVNSGVSRERVIQLMTQNKIQQIPVLNETQHVIGLHLWDELNRPLFRSNKMVIMAGGKGTRLHPQTLDCPKPLLLISGKPILEHIIERAKAEGFSNFILAVHYLGEMIEDYFGNGDRLGVKIEYLREELPLGTVGALSLLDPVPEKPIVVTNGDVVTDIRYGELLDFHIKNSAKATMAVRLHEWQNPFGVVETIGIEISGYEEKPVSRSYINAGVYVIEPDTIELIPHSTTCDMPTLFSLLKSQGDSTIAYAIHEPWLDVGRLEDLEKAQNLNEK
jgi:dTDP-glucose pyrophosphorylase